MYGTYFFMRNPAGSWQAYHRASPRRALLGPRIQRFTCLLIWRSRLGRYTMHDDSAELPPGFTIWSQPLGLVNAKSITLARYRKDAPPFTPLREVRSPGISGRNFTHVLLLHGAVRLRGADQSDRGGARTAATPADRAALLR